MKIPDKVIIEVTGDAIAVRVCSGGDVVSFREANPISIASVDDASAMTYDDLNNFFYLGTAISDAIRCTPEIAEALRELR